MSFRLKEAVYKVRCKVPGCPFVSEFAVRENIMGLTEADVDTEALKIARNLGFIKHDTLFGRKHPLENPEVTKMSATYERLGGAPAPAAAPAAQAAPAAPGNTRTYRRGEVILKKGESAATVCEVMRGLAYNINHPDMPYKTGATFGIAALWQQKSRLADVVAGEDGTIIAFHNLRLLVKTDPPRAHELYNDAMDDVFNILVHLEGYIIELEKKVKRQDAEAAALKAKLAASSARPSPRRSAAPRTKRPAPTARKSSPAKKKPATKKPAQKLARKR